MGPFVVFLGTDKSGSIQLCPSVILIRIYRMGESVHARERAREGFAVAKEKTGAAVLRQSFPGQFNPIRVHPIPVQVGSAVPQVVSVLPLINKA